MIRTCKEIPVILSDIKCFDASSNYVLLWAFVVRGIIMWHVTPNPFLQAYSVSIFVHVGTHTVRQYVHDNVSSCSSAKFIVYNVDAYSLPLSFILPTKLIT